MYNAGVNASPSGYVTLQVPAHRISPRTKEALEIYLDNPKLTRLQIANRMGVSQSRVRNLFSTSRFINLLRMKSKDKLTSAVPLATDSFIDCVKQNNSWDTKFKASVRLLEDQNVVGKNAIDVTINKFDGMKTEELVSIVQNARVLSGPVVEGEIVE